MVGIRRSDTNTAMHTNVSAVYRDYRNGVRNLSAAINGHLEPY